MNEDPESRPYARGQIDPLLKTLREMHPERDPNRGQTLSDSPSPPVVAKIPITRVTGAPSPTDIIETPKARTDFIIKTVAETYAMTSDMLIQKGHKDGTGAARHVAVYLLRRITGKSFAEIGVVLGNRHHTTMISSYREAQREMETDSAYKDVVEGLEKIIRAKYPERS